MTRILFFISALGLALSPETRADSYERFEILTASSPASSRSEDWSPGRGIALEVSGLAWFGKKLALCIRKGEVWLIDHPHSANREEMGYQLFASGLHEPLGLLADGRDLLVSQRGEITRLQDRDQDGVADAYLTECDGWSVTGAYHAYTYGPKRDGLGNLWVTLNLDMGDFSNNHIGWRGWGGMIGKNHTFQPASFGMRSPCGLGANLEGDMFFSDQQGTWIPATPLYHLRPGVFYGNQEALATQKLPGAPFQLSRVPRPNQPYPDALAECPEFVPPAVWLPYNKMGRSATDIEVIASERFGPFQGQLLVGEFTNSAINRVFLEKVNGQYQGACFPFLSGFPAAVLRLLFDEDGTLFVGMTNRGWSSLGNRSYGLERVKFNGKTPFAIREMRARPDGFELEFTQPVNLESVESDAFSMESYTYEYSPRYGGDEIQKSALAVTGTDWTKDGKTVRLRIEGLKPFFVHELKLRGILSIAGKSLDHPRGYYTLNAIPTEE